VGSRIDPITTSHGQPIASASATTADVFPVPGLPQSSTGTPAEMAIVSASETVLFSMP